MAGLVTLTYSISYAALIFSGDLAPYLSLGVSMALIGAVILGVSVACMSSLPFVIAGPDGNAAALLALIATTIAQELHAQGRTSQIPVTVGCAIALSTILTGILLFILGRLRFGRFIRFIPYPVLGGFLAIVGVLLTQGSFTVMTGRALIFSNLSMLLTRSQVVLWFPGLVLAVGLKFLLPRYQQFWVLPAILLGTTLLIHGGLAGLGIPLDQAIAQGWLFEPFPSTNPLQVWQTLSWQDIAWPKLTGQMGSLLTLFAVVAITILLCATSIEMATEQDMDLDQELRAAGLANAVTGLCGGMVGHLSVSRSLLNRAAGATHPLAGIVAASFCGGMAIFGNRLLSYLPRAVLGGLLLYLGITLLIEWLYEAWFKLSKLDYALIVAIVMVGAKFGFLAGVGVGLMIACFMFALNYSRLRVIRNTLSGLTYQSKFKRSVHEQQRLRERGAEIWIGLVQGYLFFGTAYTLLNQIRQRLNDQTQSPIRFLVLDFRLVSGLDSSAINSFVKLKQIAIAQDVLLIFTTLNPSISNQLASHGSVIREQDEAVQVFADLDRAVEWCEAKILESFHLRRKRFLPLAIHLEDFFTDTRHIRPFMKYLERCRLEAGDMLFAQGEPADALYFLESGQVSLFLTLDDGQSKRLQTSSAGTVLGDVGLYRRAAHRASGVADQPSRLYKLAGTALMQMQTEAPHLAAAFHESIARLLADQVVRATDGVEKLLQ
ncbi:MAG: cyclic nucleotide-binding domain-containing protein [Spirulina sp. SIO3F2]|nr:cyclic nucleotide-binding domain-containing protein [Spirulina sp. SIO3F2]